MADDDDMTQAIMEANIPEDAMDVSDLGNLNANDVNTPMLQWEAEATKEKLVQRLGNLGINAKRTRLPLKSDADCEVTPGTHLSSSG